MHCGVLCFREGSQLAVGKGVQLDGGMYYRLGFLSCPIQMCACVPASADPYRNQPWARCCAPVSP